MKPKKLKRYSNRSRSWSQSLLLSVFGYCFGSYWAWAEPRSFSWFMSWSRSLCWFDPKSQTWSWRFWHWSKSKSWLKFKFKSWFRFLY